MNFYPIFWKEMLLIRKKPWRFLASSLVMPLLYLVTFGWGLGRGMRMNGGSYLEFVLPGILALSAMNNSFGPVSTSLNISKLYTKTIEEVLVSPVSPRDIALGRTLTGLVRGMFSAFMLLAVGLATGVRLQMTAPFFLVLALTAFWAGTFFAPEHLPEPFHSLILVYPLTHASLLLRALASGSPPALASLLGLVAYTLFFFYLAVRMVARAGKA
jgi:ABC-type polysaccharide/polyol phosphate export permease